jgi:hypothetical protein
MVLISRYGNNSTIGTVLVNPGRFNKGLVLLYIAKGKKRLVTEIVPKLLYDNLLLSATSSIGTALILIPWFELFLGFLFNLILLYFSSLYLLGSTFRLTKV